MLLNIFTIIMLVFGCFFFIAGTVGLIRFPDVFCRLHALTKSDNLGLGLIALGLLPQANSVSVAVKLLIIWLLLLITSAASCHLIARNEHRKQIAKTSTKHQLKEQANGN